MAFSILPWWGWGLEEGVRVWGGLLWSVAAGCCWSLLVVGCRFVVAVVAAAAEAVLGRRCDTR